MKTHKEMMLLTADIELLKQWGKGSKYRIFSIYFVKKTGKRFVEVKGCNTGSIYFRLEDLISEVDKPELLSWQHNPNENKPFSENRNGRKKLPEGVKKKLVWEEMLNVE